MYYLLNGYVYLFYFLKLGYVYFLYILAIQKWSLY